MDFGPTRGQSRSYRAPSTLLSVMSLPFEGLRAVSQIERSNHKTLPELRFEIESSKSETN